LHEGSVRHRNDLLGEVQEHYEMLAGHFTETETMRSARYSKLAAKNARNRFMAAALNMPEWIAVLEKMPRSNDVQKRS